MIETPSDREFACFFCIDSKENDIGAHCRKCGRPIDIGHRAEGIKISSYTLQSCIGRGYYGATFKATTGIGMHVALKIVPKNLYAHHQKSFTEEMSRYAALGAHPNIAELRDAGETEITIDGVLLPIYFIVMEWIEGVSLSRFIKTHAPLSASIVYGAIRDIAVGLSRFEEKNLWHNDLNSDNIMVKRRSPEEIRAYPSESPVILKIVDTGSAVFRQAFHHKSLDDLTFLGHHADELLLAARGSADTATLEDQYFLDQLGPIVGALLDESPSRRLPSALEVIDQLNRLYLRRHLLSEQPDVRLNDPFEYLNANDFPNDSFVTRLFAEHFPWLSETIMPAVQSMLITGPRGSGKTMILRSMRLRTRLSSLRDDEPISEIRERLINDDFVGFFVSARLEIGNHSLITKLPKWMQSPQLVIYYFHLLYAYEVCDSVMFAVVKNILQIDREREFVLCQFLSASLNETVVSISSALSILKQRQAAVLYSKIEPDENSLLLKGTFLSQLCDCLKLLHPIFGQKKFIFLLDDFSVPKIPSEVQRSLLPLIWNSGAGYTFRVTAHSESMETVDLRSNVYVVNREYREINLGAVYINAVDVRERRELISKTVNEIFAKRFALSKSSLTNTIESLLGYSKITNIAREIKERSEKHTLRGLRYGGWDTIISLCSGDISYVIDLLKKMFELHAGKAKRSKIQLPIQNKIIRNYARQELYKLQDYSSPELNLFEIALRFGMMSRFKLLSEEIKQKEGSRPAEYLRIEIQLTQMTEYVRNGLAELVRNGIFIDAGFSSSSQGIPARRIIFRKMFTPAFPTTFNSRDTFSMTSPHFLRFLKDPQGQLTLLLGEAGVPPHSQSQAMEDLFRPDVE
jgi:serine/threonine protein kinase